MVPRTVGTLSSLLEYLPMDGILSTKVKKPPGPTFNMATQNRAEKRRRSASAGLRPLHPGRFASQSRGEQLKICRWKE